MKKYLILIWSGLVWHGAYTQLNVSGNARVNMSAGSYIVATGDVTSESGILGAGVVVLSGTNTQHLNMNSNLLPGLEINNAANILLSGNIRVSQKVNFVNGKLLLGQWSFSLEPTSVIAGAGAERFFETDGPGRLSRKVTANVTSLLFPLGSGSHYAPVTVSTEGTYENAEVFAGHTRASHPNKPSAAGTYLHSYCSIRHKGIKGNVSASTTYQPANIFGVEALLEARIWTGTEWIEGGARLNRATRQLTATVTGTGSDIYAMSDVAGSVLPIRSRPDADVAVPTLRIFPNPTRGAASIEIYRTQQEQASITVYDFQGKIVQSRSTILQKGASRTGIDLTGFAGGTYNIQVRSASVNTHYKIIKQ